jgi:hypothetical protein
LRCQAKAEAQISWSDRVVRQPSTARARDVSA